MSVSVCTITRYDNGLTVYEDQGYRVTPRRLGHLQLAAFNPALDSYAPSSDDCRRAGVVAPSPISASAYLFDRDLEPAAQTFCYWMEDRYAENITANYGQNLTEISVSHMPPQAVLDRALIMLRQRGWVVVAPAMRDNNRGSSQSGRFILRQVSF